MKRDIIRISIVCILITVGSSWVICQTDTILTVYFETDKYEISNTERAKLVNYLNASDSLILTGIRINGYCDDRGTSIYNDSLSLKRAKETKKLFSELKINDTLFMEVHGKGEIQLPLERRINIEALRSKNRKAEIEISYLVNKPDSDIFPEDAALGDTIILKNILFIGGRHFLLPESYPTLDRLLATLKERSNIHIKIMGHVCCTEEIDGYDYDTKTNDLSVNRAKAIYQYLVQNGIDPNRIEYEGLGSAYKLGGAAKYDRRVEIKITKMD